MLCAGSAAGEILPPHVIVKGKTVRSLYSLRTEDAPVGTKFSSSDSGWTKQVFHFFFNYVFVVIIHSNYVNEFRDIHLICPILAISYPDIKHFVLY